MKNAVLRICLWLTCFTSTLISQPDFPDAPDQGPIGGFALALLALGGAALGYKKLKK